MKMSGSPWLDEVPRRRPVEVLSEDDSADVVVVGGGISGLSTAYHLLKGSDQQVLLLEKDLVGHGATGHNGGQVVAGLEKRFHDLARSLGEERVTEGYRELNGGWDLLGGMLSSIGSPGMVEQVVGELGISHQDEVGAWIEEMDARRRIGMPGGVLRLANEVRMSPPHGVELVDRDLIEDLLWSKDRRYLGAAEAQVGVMNSHLFTERLAEHLLATEPGLRVRERSPVDLVRLSEEECAVGCNGRTVFCDRVVLCTNGYPLPPIQACSPPAVQGQVTGVVGQMVGRSDPQGVPGARAYFRGPREEEPYFYLTRRRYLDGWLTAAGGPEEPLRAGGFDPLTDYGPAAYGRIEAFLQSTLQGYQGPHDREWQGVMGYTSTGARVVGQDPHLAPLFYNLGCNGIGLLSAVTGGRRIAALLEDEDLAPTMFDPELLLRERRAPVQRTR